MKWFKHDSDANTDTKLKKVRHKYGIQGYGLYWYCLELIAGSISKQNISFELEEDAEIIALEWSLDQLKVQEIIGYMVEIELFDVASNNRVRCLKLAKRLDDTNAKNPEIKAVINRINSESVGETPSKSDQTRLDKTRLDKTIKKKDAHSALAAELGVDVGLIERIVKHRIDMKKPANTDKKIKLIINNFKQCVEQGLFQTLDQVMDKLDTEAWLTVKPEYLQKKNIANHSMQSQSQAIEDFVNGNY